MSKPYITIKHIIVEIVGYVIWLSSLILAIINVVTGEGDIVTNYDLAGNPTGYGSRGNLLAVPLIMLSVLIVLSLTSHFGKDSNFHFGKPIRPEKMLIALSDSVMMVFMINIVMALYGLFITIVMAYGYGNLVMAGSMIMTAVMAAVIVGMYIKLRKDTE